MLANPTVLGLDGDDAAVASAVTQALRDELAKRGQGGGEEISALELRFNLGCDDADEDCLLRASEPIVGSEVIFGSVEPVPGGFVVSLARADPKRRKVLGRVSERVSSEDLAGASLTGSAVLMLDGLYAADAGTDAAVAPPPPGEVDESTQRGDATTPTRTRGAEREDSDLNKGPLRFGRDPAPRPWKWIGLGVSAGVAVGAGTGGLIMGLRARPNGPIYQDLVRAGEDSLLDGDPSTNVDPQSTSDLCAAARERGTDGTTRNAEMARICDRGERTATTATALWVVAGVGLLSTVTFATLLHVYRDKPIARRARDHGLRLDVAPLPEGGAWVGTGMRF